MDKGSTILLLLWDFPVDCSLVHISGILLDQLVWSPSTFCFKMKRNTQCVIVSLEYFFLYRKWP